MGVYRRLASQAPLTVIGSPEDGTIKQIGAASMICSMSLSLNQLSLSRRQLLPEPKSTTVPRAADIRLEP